MTLHETGDIIVKPPQPEILDRILIQYIVDRNPTSTCSQDFPPQESLPGPEVEHVSGTTASSVFNSEQDTAVPSPTASAGSGYKAGSESSGPVVQIGSVHNVSRESSEAIVQIDSEVEHIAHAIREAHHETHVLITELYNMDNL